MRVIVVSDASRYVKNKSAGYGYFIKCNRGEVSGGGRFKRYTANTEILEAMAAINAVAIGRSKGLIRSGDKVSLYVDNLAAIRLLRCDKPISTLTARQRGMIYEWHRVKKKIQVCVYHVKSNSTDAHSFCDSAARNSTSIIKEIFICKR